MTLSGSPASSAASMHSDGAALKKEQAVTRLITMATAAARAVFLNLIRLLHLDSWLVRRHNRPACC